MPATRVAAHRSPHSGAAQAAKLATGLPRRSAATACTLTAMHITERDGPGGEPPGLAEYSDEGLPVRRVEVAQRFAVALFVLQPMKVSRILECDLGCMREAVPDDVG